MEAPRMNKNDVREMLDNPDVSIVDLRSEEQWQKSGTKVRGAVREDRDNVDSWAGKYDKNKTLILYCA